MGILGLVAARVPSRLRLALNRDTTPAGGSYPRSEPRYQLFRYGWHWCLAEGLLDDRMNEICLSNVELRCLGSYPCACLRVPEDNRGSICFGRLSRMNEGCIVDRVWLRVILVA